MVPFVVSNEDVEDEDEASTASNISSRQPQAPAVPILQHGDQLWCYRDPESKIRGPFESDKMLELFNTGKLHPETEVNRICDMRFISLEDMERLYNRVPFTPGPRPAPLVDNKEERLKQQEERMQQLQHQERRISQLLRR